MATYREREREILSQTAPGPGGRPTMTPEARQSLSARLAGVAAVSPVLADRLESSAARRLEFLAAKMPRRPEVAGLPIGPDRWQPPDFEIAKFARYVAAVEDPAGAAERLTDGTLTPEDAEALREVYPETFADLQMAIMERLPELRESLPYERRLSLSILSGGIPVDPAMDPRIVSVLQGGFEEEPGTAGGTAAPKALPQFGSVKKSTGEPTAAQRRAG